GSDLAVNVMNVESEIPEACHARLGDRARFVRGIVQHLNLQQVPGPIHGADRLDQALNDIHLVVDGKLHRNNRLLRKGSTGDGSVILVFVVQINHVVAMDAINGQNREDKKVTEQNEQVEAAAVVQISQIVGFEKLL